MAIVPNIVKVDMNGPVRKVLIDAGTHFWCTACFFTLPVKYQGPDREHCIDCYNVIHSDNTAFVDELPESVEAVTKIDVGVSTSEKRKRGRPAKPMDMSAVIESGKTCRVLADETGVSAMTISRRRRSAQGRMF